MVNQECLVELEIPVRECMQVDADVVGHSALVLGVEVGGLKVSYLFVHCHLQWWSKYYVVNIDEKDYFVYGKEVLFNC